MKIKEFLAKNRETAQLVYGIALVVLIPLLIAFNTVFIIKKYNASLDVVLQRHALSIGRTIYALVKYDLGDEEKMQDKVVALKNSKIELEDLAVLKPEGDDFKIIAATKEEDKGKILSFYYYNLAWMQPDNDGLATDSLRLAATPGGQSLVGTFSREDRFWLVAMPMSDAKGEKQALLTMKLSSKIIDDLTNYNRNISIALLVAVMLAVILFLLVAVRLWDYALLYKKIKEVDQMKDEFISMASHELRTPVAGIRGYISMILEGTFGQVSDKIKETLNIVQHSSDRLATLVEDLLNVSRIEQGRLKINRTPQDVDPIIQEIIAEMKVQADEKKLVLNYNSYVKKPLLIKIDGDRFKQVLINLIGNAIKYTRKGKVEVKTVLKGKTLEIRVKDTGMGMSAEERGRLFEKFYRVQNEKTQNITGTGLGLWITKQLVELMRGTITVDSIKNVGTQVTLSFPVVKE